MSTEPQVDYRRLSSSLPLDLEEPYTFFVQIVIVEKIYLEGDKDGGSRVWHDIHSVIPGLEVKRPC